jgi:hypothetical protein
MGFLVRLHQQGHSVNPLLGAPLVETSIFQIDWLHTADKGITADYLGNLMAHICRKMPGGNEHAQIRNLFLDLQAWYKATGADSCLQTLTKGMLGSKGSRKLSCKAAEARALVPWAVTACEKYLSSDCVREVTMSRAATELLACYNCLSKSQFDHDILKEHSRKFAVLLCSLETPFSWRVMPKLHLWQEMNEEQMGCPATCWVYRDEDFGGSVMQLAKRKGGAHNPRSTAAAMLYKFTAKHDLPML